MIWLLDAAYHCSWHPLGRIIIQYNFYSVSIDLLHENLSIFMFIMSNQILLSMIWYLDSTYHCCGETHCLIIPLHPSGRVIQYKYLKCCQVFTIWKLSIFIFNVFDCTGAKYDLIFVSSISMLQVDTLFHFLYCIIYVELIQFYFTVYPWNYSVKLSIYLF